MEPCQTATYDLQVLIALLGALNAGLATWLAHRRLLADRERRNGASTGNRLSGSHVKKAGDDGGPTDGPPES